MDPRGGSCGGRVGWYSCAFPGAPTPAAVAGEKTGTSSAVPAAAAAPALGNGRELVTVGVQEAEQRPLPRILFRRGPRFCFSWQPGPSPRPSAVVPGLFPGAFWPQALEAAIVWGLSCALFPIWRPLPGPLLGPCVLSFSGVSLAAISVASLPSVPAQCLGLA